MGFVHRRILRAVLAVVHHPKITLFIAALTIAASALGAMRFLTISTSQNELFSSKPWFFHDYLQFIKEFPENEALYLVIEPKDFSAKIPVERWAAAADHVTERVRQNENVLEAFCKTPLDELGRQALLFADPKSMPQVMAGGKNLAQLASLWGERPAGLVGTLGRTPIERQISAISFQPTEDAQKFIDHLVRSWDDAVLNPHRTLSVGNGVTDFVAMSATSPLDLGYQYVADESDPTHYRILVTVYPKRIFESLTSVTKTINSIRQTAYDAGADYPDFQIEVTGRPALEADQMAITDADSHKAEAIALTFVFIGMAIALRSIWLALVAEIALGAGIAWTFGWATIAIGQLNLLSLVFLIALIGIGMDYLVQILTRYRLETRRYSRPSEVWLRVFKYVGPPVNTACLGAAGAFMVAIFTDFRGAAELGMIAGPGLILCLVAGYTVIPAILTLFPKRLPPLPPRSRYKPMRRSSRGWLALPVVWAVLLGIGTQFMPRAGFDPGLISLQVSTLPSVKLIRTLQTWVAVVLSKDLNQIRAANDAVVGTPGVASTDSILKAYDNLAYLKAHAGEIPSINWARPPAVSRGDLSAIAAKSRNLARVFAKDADSAALLNKFARDLDGLSGPGADAAARQLSSWQEIFVDELRGLLDQFHPGSLDLAALPVQLRGHYVSEDGYYALYIYPVKDLWNNVYLNQFEIAVEKVMSGVPGKPEVTGIASDVYHTTEATHDAFFHTTIYALALIFILVLLDFRRLGPTLAAISVLAMGLPMLVALMGLTGTDWNFANFFGLPILIGAGHEYGVFMVHRYLEAKKYPRRTWRTWDVSDRALLLCAYITSTSFGFFWLLAQHKGLKSLGLVMALGTACIYFATIVVLRPLLKWRLQKSLPAPVD